jgi:WD40 repeat protein
MPASMISDELELRSCNSYLIDPSNLIRGKAMRFWTCIFCLLVMAGCQRSPPELKLRWEGRCDGFRVAFSPDGKTIASSGSFKGLPFELWDVATGKNVSVIDPQNADISCDSFYLSFSPDGKTIASAVSYNAWGMHEGGYFIELFDVVSGKKKASLKMTDYIDDIAFSPNGKIIASGSRDKVGDTIQLWDAKTLKISAQYNTNRVRYLAFSPDGKILASVEYKVSNAKNDAIEKSRANKASVRLWDVTQGKEIAVLQFPKEVRSVAFSPDGKTLASSGSEEEISLWDVDTHTKRNALKTHSSPVYSVAFSPNGKLLASSCDNGTIEIWDLTTGMSIISTENIPTCTYVAFSPDGESLAGVGGKHNTVLFWDIK